MYGESFGESEYEYARCFSYRSLGTVSFDMYGIPAHKTELIIGEKVAYQGIQRKREAEKCHTEKQALTNKNSILEFILAGWGFSGG